MTSDEKKEAEQKRIDYLLQNYGLEKRYESLLTQIQDLLEAMGILDKVEVNVDLLGRAVLNYFEDIDRLKTFEFIERTNVDKIYSYEAFWLLREKPIQITDNTLQGQFLYINEKIVACLLAVKMLREVGADADSKGSNLKYYIELLYYNFKYRHFTQQSLELMVSAFFCGHSLSH